MPRNLRRLGPRITIERRPPPYTDAELHESIARNGVLHPALFLDGKILDGARRLAIAEQLGIEAPQHECPDRVEAARLLWRVHPVRAWEMFIGPGMRRINIAHTLGIPIELLPPRWDIARAGVRLPGPHRKAERMRRA